MEDSHDLRAKQSWLNRNWKWLIPSGCLTLIILVALFIGGIFYEVTSVLKILRLIKNL